MEKGHARTRPPSGYEGSGDGGGKSLQDLEEIGVQLAETVRSKGENSEETKIMRLDLLA